jgi:uncharacterized membrane protein
LIGSTGILPQGSDGYKFTLQGKGSLPRAEVESLIAQGKATNNDLFVNQIAQVQDIIPSVVVPLAFSGGLALLLHKIPMMVVVILSITTIGLLLSLSKHINRIEKTFQLGMYLILVFSLTVASMANIRTIFGIGMLNLVLFITWCYFGSLVLHIILAKIFRIDADNFLITSAAFIFSPPFVPLVANALKNKDVIVTGITGGIIGYIVGNYLGVALAYFLKGF